MNEPINNPHNKDEDLKLESSLDKNYFIHVNTTHTVKNCKDI